jgi:hypothetical protein
LPVVEVLKKLGLGDRGDYFGEAADAICHDPYIIRYVAKRNSEICIKGA